MTDLSKLSNKDLLEIIEKQQKELELVKAKEKERNVRVSREEKQQFRNHLIEKLSDENFVWETLFLSQLILGETTTNNPLHGVLDLTQEPLWKTELATALLRSIGIHGSLKQVPNKYKAKENNKNGSTPVEEVVAES